MRDLFISGPARLEAAGDTGKGRRFKMIAYTGGVMTVPGWGPVVVNLAGLQMPDAVPVLVDHDNRVAAMAGTGRPMLDNGQLIVTGELAESEAGRQVAALLTTLQASVGVSPKSTRRIHGEKLTINGRLIEAPAGGYTLIESGELREVSFVPCGSDGQTSVSLAARGCQTTGGNMEPTQIDNAEGQRAEVAATNAERDRIRGIDEAAGPFLNEPGGAELRAAAIAEGTGIVEFKARLLDRMQLDALRASRANVNGIRREGRAVAASGDVLAAAALMAGGYAGTAEKMLGQDACNRAADLRCMSAMDLCAAALRAEFRDVPRDRGELIRAAFSTTSLPQALGLSAEKAMAETFKDAPRTWASWIGRKSVRNFRPATAIRAYLAGGRYEEVAADGELKHAAIKEEFYVHKASTWGRLFTVTRQTIINDDLGVVFELAQELGRNGARSISDEVYRVLLANAGGFFAEAKDNLITGADTVLSIGGLSLAVRKFRGRTDADGKPIDVTPRVLVVPPDLEWIAKALVNSANLNRTQSATDSEPTGNPLLNVAGVEVEPRLASAAIHANASAIGWYLFAAPFNCPALVLSLLNGREEPVIEQVQLPGDVLGIGWRSFLDFGVDLADSRGAVKSKGAV
jgi:hypothetical protein